MTTTTRLTEMEQAVLRGSLRTDFGSAADDAVWVYAVIAASGIPAKQARGVISSLVQKGLAETQEYERGEFIFSLTEAGRAAVR